MRNKSFALVVFYASSPSVFVLTLPSSTALLGTLYPHSHYSGSTLFPLGYTPLSTEGLPESVSHLTAQRPRVTLNLFLFLKNSLAMHTPFRSFYKTIPHSLLSRVLEGACRFNSFLLLLRQTKFHHWIFIRRHHATIVSFPSGRSHTGRCCRWSVIIYVNRFYFFPCLRPFLVQQLTPRLCYVTRHKWANQFSVYTSDTELWWCEEKMDGILGMGERPRPVLFLPQ